MSLLFFSGDMPITAFLLQLMFRRLLSGLLHGYQPGVSPSLLSRIKVPERRDVEITQVYIDLGLSHNRSNIAFSNFLGRHLYEVIFFYYVLLKNLHSLFTLFYNTALPIHNSYAIEFTHLKYTVQWVLVYLQRCASSAIIYTQSTSSLPKRTPYSSPHPTPVSMD